MKCEFEVTWERYRSWVITCMWMGRGLVARVIALIFAAFYFFAAIFSAVQTVRGESDDGFGWALGMLALSVMFVLVGIFERVWLAKFQYRRAVKALGKNSFTRCVRFEEDGFFIEDPIGSTKFSYALIVSLDEKDDRIRMVFANKNATFLYRSGFADGTWEQCRAYIEKQRAVAASRL